MRNQYTWWQYSIIGIVVLIGMVYALPNLFGQNPSVQISPVRAAITLDDSLYSRVLSELETEGLPVVSAELEGQRLLVRFLDTDTQLKAADVLSGMLEARDYTVAHNLAPATPDFMQSLDMEPMNLGLDLRGGLHFLIEVDMQAAIQKAEQSYAEAMRIFLREQTIRYAAVGIDSGGGVRLSLRSPEQHDEAVKALRGEFPQLQISDSAPGEDIVLTMTEAEIEEKRQFALQQNITTIRNRVNELGVAEPVVQRQGDNRIVVQLPGMQDTAGAKRILGATATLEFRLVDEDNDPQQVLRTGRTPLNSQLFYENGQPRLLQKRVLLTGEYITDAASGIDQQTGRPAVFITLDGKGANRFENATKDNIGKLLAVLFIENKTIVKRVDGKEIREPLKTEDVINVAEIMDRLSSRFQITGLDSTTEARNLALLLRAGALAAPITIVEERTVGPSAGKDNIRQGYNSALIAFALVLLFMAFYYRRFGMVSDLALIINVVLIIAVLSMLQATLTLPGIAGVILTMGMAVDANVLIFERVREELKMGNSPQAAIHTGFSRALGTILDANITTFIAAIVLFSFGTGPIKGFAVTLSIGIVSSVFTAVVAARGAINYMYGGRNLQTLPI